MSHTLTSTNVHADRAAEYNRLLAQQGTLARSRRLFPDSDYSQYTDEEHERCRRLEDLAELINANLSNPDDPAVRRDVAFDVEKWIERNPVVMTTQILRQMFERREGIGGVYALIGAAQGGDGYYYRVMHSDVKFENGDLKITIPESVAEFFRNQGRSRIRREFTRLLGL